MRTRKEIENENTNPKWILKTVVELLLDIRDLLTKKGEK